MHRSHQRTSRPSTALSLVTVAVLLAALCSAGGAHAQKISQAISVAVMPFVDLSEQNSSLIAEMATDAVSLALDDSQEFVVTPRADTKREMEALGIVKPDDPRLSVSDTQMVRLGERLRVEKVANGDVGTLSISEQGECHCVLTVRLLDVATDEYLDGATYSYTTKPVPGWNGEESDIINEALRSAAEGAVRTIQTSRRPRGNVDIVDYADNILVNLGKRDGVEVGMELLTVRGVWNAALERVVMQKIGVIEVTRVEPHMSTCKLVSGTMPRTSDKCHVMYRPASTVQKARSKARLNNLVTWVAGAGLLWGIIGTATGADSSSPPAVEVLLSQAAPGSEPRVRVNALVGDIPGNHKTHGWLVFRGNAAGFPAIADSRNYLISALPGSRLSNFEDDPARSVNLAFELTFEYLDENSDREEGSVSATYNHLELSAGSTYYYKLQRIVDPGRVRIPFADATGVGTQQVEELADVDFEADPADCLSEPSDPAGPITYFYPPTPETPSDGNEVVDWDASKGNTVFRWRPSYGANEYQVRIYNNASASGRAVQESPVLSTTSTGSTGSMSWTMAMDLSPASTYYWFVAARVRGETEPIVQSTGDRGWILSRAFSLKTVTGPPASPTGVDGSTGRARPSSPRDPFGFGVLRAE